MRRGNVVVAVTSGAYGKPRPFVVIQSDVFDLASITLAPITSTLEPLEHIRPQLDPTESNGLRHTSLVMCDKIQTIPVGKVGGVIGRLTPEEMRSVDAAIALFLGLA